MTRRLTSPPAYRNNEPLVEPRRQQPYSAFTLPAGRGGDYPYETGLPSPPDDYSSYPMFHAGTAQNMSGMPSMTLPTASGMRSGVGLGLLHMPERITSPTTDRYPYSEFGQGGIGAMGPQEPRETFGYGYDSFGASGNGMMM